MTNYKAHYINSGGIKTVMSQLIIIQYQENNAGFVIVLWGISILI